MSNTIYVENASFVFASVIAAIFHPSFKSIKTWTNNIGCTAILGIQWTCIHFSIYSPRTNYLHLHILPDWHQVHLVHWRRGRAILHTKVDKATFDINRLLVLDITLLPAKSFSDLFIERMFSTSGWTEFPAATLTLRPWWLTSCSSVLKVSCRSQIE